MGSCAGRRREAEEAAAVAWTTTLASVTVDGSLKLAWGAEAFPLALIRVQVFHVPTGENKHIHRAIYQIALFCRSILTEGAMRG